MPSTSDPSSVLTSWIELMEGAPPSVGDIPRLHHYTDSLGLHGIVSSHSLWATAAQFSNDLSEIEYSLAVAREVFQEVFGARPAHASWRRILHDHVASFFAAPSHEFNQPFIFSFCEDGDLLSQWRAYGQRSGFSLEFGQLQDSEGTVSVRCEKGFRTILRRVVYEPEKQRERLRFILGKLAALADTLPSPEAPGSAHYGELSLITILELADWTCSVKHAAFSGEREWRLISFPYFGSLGKSRSEILIRPGTDLLLPYMVLKPRIDTLPLVGVRCGPSRLQKEGARSVEILLSKHGYTGIGITRSEIPLRV